MRTRFLHLAVLFTASLALLVGCVETRVVGARTPWDNIQWDPKTEPGQLATGRRRPAQGYTVRLATLEGMDRHQQARVLVERTRAETELRGLWVSDIDGKAVLQMGRYQDASGIDARFALRQARDARIGGEPLFKDATMAPVGGASAGADATVDPWDLQQFAGYYSLQIGFYDADFTSGRRQAAEQAVKVLREEGEEAYFYHGPHRSLICIGLFTDEDFQTVEGVQVYGDHVRHLQTKYPRNLGNGRTLVEKHAEGDREQESFLVRVF